MAEDTTTITPEQEAAAREDAKFASSVLASLALTGKPGCDERDPRLMRLFRKTGAYNHDVVESLLAFVDKVDLADGSLAKSERVRDAHSSAVALINPGWDKRDPEWRHWLRSIEPYRAIENAICALERGSELAGSGLANQEWLLGELRRIAAGPDHEARAKTHALCERIAIRSLPEGVCSIMSGLYLRFSQAALKRAIKAIGYRWA